MSRRRGADQPALVAVYLYEPAHETDQPALVAVYLYKPAQEADQPALVAFYLYKPAQEADQPALVLTAGQEAGLAVYHVPVHLGNR